jgi:uncharacterized protein
MRGWRAWTVAAAVSIAIVAFVAIVLEFLAPDLSYHVKDRVSEWTSGNRGRQLRIALGTTTGSNYRIGAVLNRYLEARHGYTLELVATSSPGNAGALLDPNQRIDLATITSADDEAAKADGIYGLAALESQYFFVIVPHDSPVQEIRGLAGAVNVGVREPGQPPTIGERVLEYYGLIASAAAPGEQGARVQIVRPQRGNIVADFDSGHMTATTRTQLLQSDLIETTLNTGKYRLVPIRDHEALARSIPGMKPGVIPAGLYGPGRQIPPEPVSTIAVTQLLVSRTDVPGRIVRDILEIVYDPRFARDVRFELSEDWGRKVGALPLHPAADIFYRRNDLVTTDRLGRVSFVGSAIAGLLAGVQLFVRFRRSERVRSRRRALGSDVAALQDIRRRVETAPDAAEAQRLIRDADDILSNAEQDAANDLLDASGIASLRSMHQLCWRTLEQRTERARVPPVA